MSIFSAAIALFGKSEWQDQSPARTSRVPQISTEKKSTILLIDDDPSFLESTKGLLEGEGFKVLASSNGAKGLDLLRYASHDIDGVVLDFNMPRLNGAETLKFVRQLCPKAKVLAVSGVRASELPVEFRDEVDRFIPKPFQNSELTRNLGELLGRSSVTEPVAPRS